MNRSLLLLTLAGVASAGLLFSLPRSVVQNEGASARQVAAASGQVPEKATAGGAPSAALPHLPPLSEPKRRELEALKSRWQQQPADAATAEALTAAYAEAMRFDSAAYVAEALARRQPTALRKAQAADQYYNAFTYAEGPRAEAMGQKARELYEAALAENPGLLQARANLAMTYVATPTPMKGIVLLREVLEQDPDFEPALFNMGMLSMRSNQFDKAMGRFERILRNEPNNLRAMFYLGVCQAELGQQAKARQTFESVRQRTADPDLLAGVEEYLKQLN